MSDSSTIQVGDMVSFDWDGPCHGMVLALPYRKPGVALVQTNRRSGDYLDGQTVVDIDKCTKLVKGPVRDPER